MIHVVYIRKSGGEEFNDLRPLRPHGSSHYTIKRSLNLKKQDILLSAINSGNWHDEIFKDEKLQYIAMSLFVKNKISRQQIYTILEFYQTIQDYKLIEGEKSFFPLLTDDEPRILTAEAEKIIMQDSFFDIDKKKTLEMLIASLPKSEQTYYVTEFRRHTTQYISLETKLRELKIIKFKPDDISKEIHISAGARDAIGIATYGNNYVPMILKLGVHSRKKIEEGVRNMVRYAAISYPDTKKYGDKLHGHIAPSDAAKTKHDDYHRSIMSKTPNECISCLHRFIDVVNMALPSDIKDLTETWYWADMEMTWFRDDKDYSKMAYNGTKGDMSYMFGNFLCFGTVGNYNVGSYLLKLKDKSTRLPITSDTTQNPKNFDLTICGALIVIDMLENKSTYGKLGVDVDLVPPLNSYINKVEDIYDLIKDKPPAVKAANMLLYIDLCSKFESKISVRVFKVLLDKIDKLGTEFTFSKLESHDEESNGTLLINNKINFGLNEFYDLLNDQEQASFKDYIIKAKDVEKSFVKDAEISVINDFCNIPIVSLKDEKKSLSELINKQESDIVTTSKKMNEYRQSICNNNNKQSDLEIEIQKLRESSKSYLARIYHFFMQYFTQNTSEGMYNRSVKQHYDLMFEHRTYKKAYDENVVKNQKTTLLLNENKELEKKITSEIAFKSSEEALSIIDNDSYSPSTSH